MNKSTNVTEEILNDELNDTVTQWFRNWGFTIIPILFIGILCYWLKIECKQGKLIAQGIINNTNGKEDSS